MPSTCDGAEKPLLFREVYMSTRPLSDFAIRHDRLSLVRTGARLSAWLVMLNGAGALFAAAVPASQVQALTFGLTAMSPVLALAHIGNGLALWAFLERRRGVHLASAAVALILGLVGLALVSPSAGTTTLPTSIAGSLLSLFASIALVTAWERGRSGLVHVTFGVAGFALLSLSITVIGVRVVGAFGPETERIFVGASGQGLASSVLLSLCFLALVWAEGFSTSEPPSWVPAAAGVSSLLAVLLLWRALDARETEQLKSQTLLVAQVAREAIYREARATAGALHRAAESAARGTSMQQQEGDLRALVRDLPGLTAGLRIGAGDTVVIRVPHDFDATRLSAEWQQHESRSESADTPTYLPLDDRAEQLAVVSRICLNGSCAGAVVAVLDLRVFFAKTLANAREGFLFAVHGNGRVLGTDSFELPPSFWREDLDLRLGDVQWQLSALPNDATLRQMRTTLPASVLFMGLIVSAMLPLTLLLGQAAWKNARSTERARLSAALKGSTDGIWEWDLITGNADRSAGLWHHLGYDPDAVAPGTAGWTSLIHPDDRHVVDEALARHISGAASSFEAEYRVRDRDGNWHVIVDRGRVVDRLPDGRPARLLGIRADVTAKRQMDAALRDLETLAAMGRIAARVAHEINNPLAGIQYSFLLIKDSIPPEHPQYRYVGAIEREISRIAAVTRQLYETYRPEKETSPNASLSAIVGDAVAFLEQVNRASAVRVETDLTGAPNVVPVSAAVLRQIVYNLVQNAMDASPPDGIVSVTALTTDGVLEIHVADSGPGVAPEQRRRIFEPFFSTKDSRMRSSGMGLGLALVHRSVTSAGGAIRVEQSPTGGALFIVALPLGSGLTTEVA